MFVVIFYVGLVAVSTGLCLLAQVHASVGVLASGMRERVCFCACLSECERVCVVCSRVLKRDCVYYFW